MKSVAVLLDGGFVGERLLTTCGTRPSVDDMHEFACSLVADSEELFRVYYYDCPPFGGITVHPLSGEVRDLSTTSTFQQRTRWLNEFAAQDHIAFRRGELAFRGWRLKSSYLQRIRAEGALNDATQAPPITAADVEMELQQKRVDMKIGLDVAWLASKKIVDRIILCAGDSDFVPAMKFARQEGVQVVLVPLGANVRTDLIEHADQVRTTSWVPARGSEWQRSGSMNRHMSEPDCSSAPPERLGIHAGGLRGCGLRP